ncbi:MAG: hypothetical protein E3J90_07210 [Promethearchaeota archaeon]|nr:MAG: hypothetical protein E3J90_07210 [Candidatus Lokiarchaeota archaeon]
MVLSKIKKVFLNAVKRDSFSKIVKDLKANLSFNFGNYERCYPDNHKSITNGFFQMEIEQRHESKFIFHIEAVEGNFRNHSNNLDYYEIFRTEEELWIYVKKFFSKFTDVEKLSQAVYRKFGFLQPKEGAMLFTQYNLLKNDLPDGDSFEDFLEDLEHFLRD